MKWRRGQDSTYVEDRRGRRVSGGTIAGGGGLVTIVIAVLAMVLSGGGSGGIDIGDVIGQLGGVPTGPAQADPNIQQGTGGEADDQTEDFMRAVMNDLTAFWSAQDVPGYEPTSLVLFTDAVDTGCGRATSAVGPFYCPADRLAYIDLGFFQELRDRFGAPGEFAQAYVIAHEYGHHIQNVLGVSAQVHDAPASEQEGADGLSVRTELQADCYAGLWAHSVFGPGSAEGTSISETDVRDALDAAQAIGDDRIQEQAGMDVNPETWTHGSSEQRMDWFRRGFDGGQIGLCDTFDAPAL